MKACLLALPHFARCLAGLVLKLGSSEPLKKVQVYLQKVDDPESGYSAHTDAGRPASGNRYEDHNDHL